MRTETRKHENDNERPRKWNRHSRQDSEEASKSLWDPSNRRQSNYQSHLWTHRSLLLCFCVIMGMALWWSCRTRTREWYTRSPRIHGNTRKSCQTMRTTRQWIQETAKSHKSDTMILRKSHDNQDIHERDHHLYEKPSNQGMETRNTRRHREQSSNKDLENENSWNRDNPKEKASRQLKEEKEKLTERKRREKQRLIQKTIRKQKKTK